ncbi:MAG: hypothetical protein HYT88_02385 [Candidatus Omnitrophica bacterium]|nr:hypothetical protein [Candidatus Omnitrophota bacterium]
MNLELRKYLIEAVADVQVREIITFLYKDHPSGLSFEGLKETLFLHEAFDESRLQQLVERRILTFDTKRYKVSADARQVLDRDPTILLDEFLR